MSKMRVWCLCSTSWKWFQNRRDYFFPSVVLPISNLDLKRRPKYHWFVSNMCKCRNWDIVLTSRMVTLLIWKKEIWSFVVPKGSFNILFYSKCICSKNVFFAWMFKKSHDLKMICFLIEDFYFCYLFLFKNFYFLV